MGLNQSLFLSETLEDVALLVPFDEFNIGEKLQPHL